MNLRRNSCHFSPISHALLLLVFLISVNLLPTAANNFNLREPATYIGGRNGFPACSAILGKPHRVNCEISIRAMEYSTQAINQYATQRTDPVVTEYIPEAEFYNDERILTDFTSDPHRPELAVPRVYSEREIFLL